MGRLNQVKQNKPLGRIGSRISGTQKKGQEVIKTVAGKPSLAMKPVVKEQTIAPAPEKKFPGGFIGAAAKAAYDTAKYTIDDAADKLTTMVGSLISPTKQSEVLKSPLAPKEMQQPTTPLKRAVDIGRAGVAVSNVPFLPVTTQIEAAKEIPVLKYPAEAASFIFEGLGKLGSYTASKTVEKLPISQETKDTINPLAEELSAIALQALGVKYGLKVGEKGINLEKIPLKPEAKQKIKTGSQLIVGMSMTPFSTAFSALNSRIATKVAEKQAEGIEVTPEIGKQIVEEVKNEFISDQSVKDIETVPEAKVDESTDIAPQRQKMESSVFKRMKAEKPFSLADEGKVDYETINLKEEARRAVELIEKDSSKAYKIAIGAEKSKDITSTAVNIALSEKALNDGNFSLYAKLVKNRSLEQTRRGQEIVSERGSVNDNGTSHYVKKLVASRLDVLGERYLDNISKYAGKRVSSKTKAMDIIDREVKKAQSKIKNKDLDIKEAQSIIDKLTCK